MEKQVNKEKRFLELLDPIYKSLEKYALSVSRNSADAEDIVSETVLHAFSGFDRLKDSQSFLSYLFTIASRVKFQIFRKNKKFDIIPVDDFYKYESNEINPETLADISILRIAIDKLGEKDKEILILKEISGLTMKEISSALGISIPNIKIRLFRSKKTLEKLLKNEVYHENI